MFKDSSLGLSAGVFACSAVVVWLAGTRLARYADAIAGKTRIKREMLGILLLGGVTSLPELAVAVTATLQGVPILSVTDVLGAASISIIALAVADAVSEREALTSLQGSPQVLLQGVLAIIMMALIVAPSVTGDDLLLGMGRWSWCMLGAFIGGLCLMAKSHAGDAWRPRHWAHRSSPGSAGSSSGQSLGRLVAQTAAAAACILIAGFLLARTGERVAVESGLGASFFGAVFLAFATSLPEISTAISAARLGRYEMAISDAFGTNLFNAMIIVLVDALHPGKPVLQIAGPFAAFSALLAMVLIALFLSGMIERRDKTVVRMGVDSLAAVAAYLAGIAVLYSLR